MFYNYKAVFFVILYCMCAALYFFINKQIILTGFMSGFVFGSLLVYAAVILFSFLAALLFSLASKYCYIAGCGICKITPRPVMPVTCWTVFTLVSYAAVFIIFVKMIEY